MFHVFLAPVRLVAVNDSGHLLNQRRGFPDALTRFMKFYGLLLFFWLSQGARDAEDFERMEMRGETSRSPHSSLVEGRHAHRAGHHRHKHRASYEMDKNDPDESKSDDKSDESKSDHKSDESKSDDKSDESKSDHKSDESKSDDKSDESKSDDKSEESKSDHKSDQSKSDDKSDDKSDESKSDHKSDESKSDDKSDESKSDHKSDESKSDDKSDESKSDDKSDESKSDHKSDESTETDGEKGGTESSDEERLEIQSAAKKEPDDCGPLMGTSSPEVRAQVLRCLKERKRQAAKVQETLQTRAKQERLLADESDKVEKLTEEIGDVNAMKAAYLNDEQIVKGALEKRKNKVVRQINKLDMDGEDVD